MLNFEHTLERYGLPFKVFRERCFLKNYKIYSGTFLAFLKELEATYNVNNNPFHNFIHGINVMFSAHLLSLKFEKHLDGLTCFALVLSALCHDVGHTGHTNIFEINSGSDLAMLYNDKSPL